MEPEQEILTQTHAAFRFVVEIGSQKMAAFTECTLPTVDWEIEEVKEGGHNTFIHQLPGRRKSTRLTLKGGVGKSKLWEWCNQVMSEKIDRKSITVQLLDSLLNPVAAWHIRDAYPIKWSGPQLQSNSTSVAIWSIEFACGEISIS